MSALLFDATTHTYTLGGRKLPSVTQVINAVLPGWKADPRYLDRGAAMHHGCRLYDQGNLDWNSVHPEIAERIRAWGRFLDESHFRPENVEVPMAHSIYRYAGTCDRILERAATGERVVCDLKSTIAWQVHVQLAGYALLWKEETGEVLQGAVAVELRENGTYSTEWLNARQLRYAERDFLQCLGVYNLRLRHNDLPKGESNGNGNR